MKYHVFFVSDAEDDLYEIYNYVALHDSEEKAENLFKKIEQTCHSLKSFPERGHAPPELERIGIFEFREIHYKPYRIIYQVEDLSVYIYCILDGRCSFQELLEHRLLR